MREADFSRFEPGMHIHRPVYLDFDRSGSIVSFKLTEIRWGGADQGGAYFEVARGGRTLMRDSRNPHRGVPGVVVKDPRPLMGDDDWTAIEIDGRGRSVLYGHPVCLNNIVVRIPIQTKRDLKRNVFETLQDFESAVGFVGDRPSMGVLTTSLDDFSPSKLLPMVEDMISTYQQASAHADVLRQALDNAIKAEDDDWHIPLIF